MFSFSKKIPLALVAIFICFAPLAASAAPAPSSTPAATVTDKSGTKFIAPAMELGVKIPGLKFDPVTETNGLIQVNFLAQYIGAVFNYLVAISVIAASIMIVYGGFLSILGANGMKVTEGKNKIKDALIGLLLILGAYTIVSVLNKSLVTLKALEIPGVKTETEYLLKNGTTGPLSGSTGGMNGTSPAKYPWQSKPPGSLLPPTELKPEDRVTTWPTYDKKLSSVANIDRFCTTGAKGTKGYMAKIKLLVKAVIGFGAACGEQHQCAYAQGGGTTISSGVGKVNAAPYAGYAVDFLHKNELASISDIWASPETKYCVDKYTKEGPFSINADSVCSANPLALYQKYVIPAFEKSQFFVSDCGQFVWSVYNCAGAEYQNLPTQEQWDSVKKPPGKVKTTYYDNKAVDMFKDLPAMIVSAHMNEDLDAIAAKKGGLKFGDVVYVHEGMKSHYLLYVGGRPEVNYSFMDMGGGQGAVVESAEWGSIKTTSGVKVHRPGMTLQDYVNELIQPKPILKTSGAPTGSSSPADYKGDDGVVFVWRPYTEDATEAAAPSSAPPL